MVNVFIFQSVPTRYDLRQAIRPGSRDTWYATRYRQMMHPGDLVFFWMAGDKHFKGLYGWGRIASEPYLKDDWGSHGVDVTYEQRFEKHLSVEKILMDKTLSEMLIFRAPQATNFLLTSSQAKHLIKLVKAHHGKAPSILRAGA